MDVIDTPVNSSTSSISVVHEYANAGTFQASVKLDDGSGDSVTEGGTIQSHAALIRAWTR